ncbi:hypothetical protein PtB15_7B576 [Puccinia triticina]|nr:hypothetical protein PtB15_7B576 [Puccinia triticina]
MYVLPAVLVRYLQPDKHALSQRSATRQYNATVLTPPTAREYRLASSHHDCLAYEQYTQNISSSGALLPSLSTKPQFAASFISNNHKCRVVVTPAQLGPVPTLPDQLVVNVHPSPMATSHFVSSSPTPAHHLPHPFRHLEARPSPFSPASGSRRHQTHHAQHEDHEADEYLRSSPAGSEGCVEAEDQAEYYDDRSPETDELEDEDQAGMMDEHDQHASGSIATAPPTPSPNPYGTTFPESVRNSVSRKNTFLPAHLFAPNPNAMPPSSSPYAMDISPAPARRCNIPRNSLQTSSFQAHHPDDPFAGSPSRSQPKTLWKASPTTSETRRTIGLRKALTRPQLPIDTKFVASGRAGQRSPPCPLARASSDGMDIDSPSYTQPNHGDGNDARSSHMSSDDQATGTSRLIQRTSRSASQSSIGKRSRSDEDDDREHLSSRPSSSGSNGRQLAPQKRIASPPRLSLPAHSQGSRLFAPTPTLPAEENRSFSPYFSSSSPSENMSPSIKAAAKLTLGRKAGERSLSGFHFPTSKPHLPSAPILSSSRSQQYGKGSLGSASGSSIATRRAGLGVVQSSATLFSRHQSASSSSTVVNRQRDAIGRPASKSRRAMSFAAGRGKKLDLLLQSNSMAVDLDEEDEESDMDASSAFNCSPMPRTANPLVSGTWPKSSESPIRPNKSSSCIDSMHHLTRKSSAPGPSGSRSLAPPPFNHGMADQSPTRPLIATIGAAVESPVGMAFSEKERAGKILPCHKVSNDGLMRISPQTMNRLLEGEYDDSITHKVIVDCRFGYEYEGGHIRSAINIQDKKAVDKMLLQGGLFARGERDVPLPSESGKVDSAGQRKKVVVVFHCEYSAMRAPTVAKYLREQDRHKNMPHYPALHYPEVYILEGGYAQYFVHSPQHCDGEYVKMDDPSHRSDRHADLNQFRTRESSTFSRAKSFTFGENKKVAKKGKKPVFLIGQTRVESHRQRDIFGAKPSNEGSSQYSRIVEEDEEDMPGHLPETQ